MPPRSHRQLRQSTSSRKLFEQLDAHQKDGVEFAVAVKTALLAFEQGTGKTWICGGVLERLFSPSFIGLLVVPLGNLDSTWLTFLAAHLPYLPIYRTWETFKSAPSPKLFLTHYEALSKAKLIEKVRRPRYTFIGYDELQRIKNRSSLQSRIAAKLRSSAEYKLGLTGTPLEENPSDLWAQFRFVNPLVLGTRWKDFEDRYLEPIDATLKERFDQARPGSLKWKLAMRELRIAGGKRSFNFDRLDEFLRAIQPFAMRVTRSVLNLPEMVVHRVPVMLRGAQRRLYDDISKDMVANIDSARLTTRLRVTQLGRLQQICGGYVTDDEGDFHEVGRAKLRELRKIVKRRPKPIVVFCRYLEEVWSIADELSDEGLRVSTLTGRVKAKDRKPLVDSFQAGEIDVLVCQVRTGGVGIDLFRAHTAIFFSYTYSHIDFEQAIARLHRRGQEYVVHLFLMFAIDTVDEGILDSLRKKRKITGKVLVSLERRRHYGEGKGEARQ